MNEDPRYIGQALAALAPSTFGDFASYTNSFNGLCLRVTLEKKNPDASFGKLVGAMNAKPL
jgi:hypothetical protein